MATQTHKEEETDLINRKIMEYVRARPEALVAEIGNEPAQAGRKYLVVRQYIPFNYF